ncbi:MAG: hypothetical protein DBW62_08645 [Microbacterium sp.]|nr:MAG: hypothetical protein DBW62_08645 [Microbacterium sp.]
MSDHVEDDIGHRHNAQGWRLHAQARGHLARLRVTDAGTLSGLPLAVTHEVPEARDAPGTNVCLTPHVQTVTPSRAMVIFRWHPSHHTSSAAGSVVTGIEISRLIA